MGVRNFKKVRKKTEENFLHGVRELIVKEELSTERMRKFRDQKQIIESVKDKRKNVFF
jgi:hypothetical protein